MKLKKLSLKKETLRALTDSEADQAAAGRPASWGSACDPCWTDACVTIRWGTCKLTCQPF